MRAALLEKFALVAHGSPAQRTSQPDYCSAGSAGGPPVAVSQRHAATTLSRRSTSGCAVDKADPADGGGADVGFIDDDDEELERDLGGITDYLLAMELEEPWNN